MRSDHFSEEAVREAYAIAAEKNGAEYSEFSEASAFFNFAVTSLGPGLALDVECDTTLPTSTPAELREKKFQTTLAKSQKKANAIAKKQAAVAARLAQKMERKMRKDQRAQ